MISSPQFSRFAAACAALLIAGALAQPARAQDVTCKDDAVSISGRAKFRPFTKTKELEGRGSAMADAVANWEREVGTRFGAKWGTWSRATNTTFSCEATKTGKVIGSSFIGCTISGRPCARTSPLAGAIVEDDDGKEVRRPRGKRDRVDEEDDGNEVRRPRGKRDRVDDDDDRDRGSRSRTYERWKYRAPKRRIEWSRAYRREMAYQDYLATARRKAESRAYRREMAYQDHLAAARSRAEAAAWRREEARQRYLANQRRWAERRRMWAY